MSVKSAGMAIGAVILGYSAPLAAFGIFTLALLEPALQIELAQSVSIPTHWSMFLAGLIGGGIGTTVAIIKKVYEKQNIDIQKRVEELQHEKRVMGLERDLSEQRIMLNSAVYNEDWLEANMKIEDLEKILYNMREKKGLERVREITTADSNVE